MPNNRVHSRGRAALGAAFFLCIVVASISRASAAGYPRRIAVAPFVSSAKEDIGTTVAVLPRLLASRLMALAGADVLLLPAEAKSPEEAAREAKYPLLLQGTVSKLGKGYSVDTTVTDLATGASAGAFFAAAPTEDDIIPQLGVLSGEIAEKLFGVQGAAKAVSPQPAPPASPVAPPAGLAEIAALPIASATPAAQATGPSSQTAVPSSRAIVPADPAEWWIPSSMKKIGQSDKVADELYGVVAGDVDAEGNGDVITWGRNIIYVYRVKGVEILPYTRISRGISHHFLNVCAIDLDGDGKKDLVVTDLEGDRLLSFVMLRKGDGFVEIPGTVPYHFTVLRGWNGKTVLAGQRGGVVEPFQGKIHVMKWDGKILSEGEALPLDTGILPISAGGVYTLSPGEFGKDGQWLYVDVEEKLRVLDAKGKPVYKSKEKFGSGADGFEYGEISRMEQTRPVMTLRTPPGVAQGKKGNHLILVNEVKKGILKGMIHTFEATRLVILAWEGGGVAVRASSPWSDFFYSGSEPLPPGEVRRGGMAIASVIEQSGSAFKEKSSRLELFRIE